MISYRGVLFLIDIPSCYSVQKEHSAFGHERLLLPLVIITESRNEFVELIDSRGIALAGFLHALSEQLHYFLFYSQTKKIIHKKFNMASPTTYYTVPTKCYDGDGSPKPKHVVGGTQQDAFSRYSNDLLRMKAILLFSEDEDVDQGDDDLDSLAAINRALNSVGISNLDLNQGQGNTDASKRRRGNHSRPIEQNQRKTRLTWELHPILLLHDLMPALEAEDHEHYVSEEEEDEPILDLSQAHGTEKEN